MQFEWDPKKAAINLRERCPSKKPRRRWKMSYR
jgi:hypothetical protein